MCLIVCSSLFACQEDIAQSPSDTTQVANGEFVDTAQLVALGEQLYNDTNLSDPVGQSCASCHDPLTGFDDPDAASPTSLGTDGASIGTRNSPTASYAAHIPESQIVLRNPPGGGPAVPVLIGGQFWDGREASLEDQAKGPFLNPVEMANASKAAVVAKISVATYATDFENLFGTGIFTDVDASYDHIADAIAAFERTDLFSPFTSKFDQVAAGTAVFTVAEERGRLLFNGKAQCRTCHETDTGEEMFSDFEFKNIGVPSNTSLITALANPTFIDNGLGDVTGQAQDNGKFRTSSLRNIAITAPYMHNGVFDTLEEVIDFYNRRDLDVITPEVAQNVDNRGNIGELGLTNAETQDLIAFLETLTDQ